MPAALPTILRAPRALLGSPLLKPLTDVAAIDDLLGQVRPTWSLREIRARVVERIAETADATTLVLEANRHWRGFAAGQHVAVTVEIDGVRHTRTYSLSSAAGITRRFAITVKRQGKVSGFLNQRAAIGTVLTLSAARGDFVLPESAAQPLLFVAAGSGITPLMSMLRTLAARGERRDVVLVHACRGPADAIFGDEIAALARDWPQLRVVAWHSARSGRLDGDGLARAVTDLDRRLAFLCGPAGFMQAIEAHYAARQRSSQLHLERFGAAPLQLATGAPARIDCAASGRRFDADTVNPLLPQAEGAGLQPASGCRVGICMSCKCVKRSGRVQNLVTGEICDEPDTPIQLCITAARSDLVLDL